MIVVAIAVMLAGLVCAALSTVEPEDPGDRDAGAGLSRLGVVLVVAGWLILLS